MRLGVEDFTDEAGAGVCAQPSPGHDQALPIRQSHLGYDTGWQEAMDSFKHH